MKLINAFVAFVMALTLAGCYWAPQEAQSGSVSLTLGLPRGVVAPGTYTYAMRVVLYEEGDVKALYGDPPASPTPYDLYDAIGVSLYGAPIELDGNPYYDVDLGEMFDPYNTSSGSFTIPDILPGKRYRIHVRFGQYDPAPDFYSNYEGVSDPFEVVPGGVVDVALNLYQTYAY